MPFAAALSEHPTAAHAVGEAAGQLLEALGPGPDLLVAFLSGPHARAAGATATTLRAALAPRTLVGATAAGVLGGGREVEGRGAVALLGARLPVPPRPVRLQVRPGPAGPELTGVDHAALAEAACLVLVADPFTVPVGDLLAALSAEHPHLAVVGGLASAAVAPGGNRLLLDDQVAGDGAVGLLLGEEVAPRTLVSQGCRPIGEPLVVTRAERGVVHELAGRPALDRLRELLEGLVPEERALVAEGLQVGIVIDEHQLDFTSGDFLIRAVLGVDRATGAVALGEEVEVGRTVQFQVRDAESADADLRALLADATGDAALVFTCTGRGRELFGAPHHDAEALSDHLGPRGAVAGMFSAGELGPVGGRSHLHSYTASVALFADDATAPAGPPPPPG